MLYQPLCARLLSPTQGTILTHYKHGGFRRKYQEERIKYLEYTNEDLYHISNEIKYKDTLVTNSYEIQSIKHYIEESKKRISPNSSDSEYFLTFCVDRILSQYSLSYEQIDQGSVDGGSDGGIDAIYIFVNGMNITNRQDLEKLPQTGVIIDIYFLQAKYKTSVQETEVDKASSTMSFIFNFSDESYQDLYNSRLVEKIKIIRDLLIKAGPSHPTISINYDYATISDLKSTSKQSNIKLKELEKNIPKTITNAKVFSNFIGAPDLLKLCGQTRNALSLKFREYFSSGDGNFVGLCTLEEYLKILKDDNNNLRPSIFDSNVRDYEGVDVQVNQDILSTLESLESPNFWWLNNGVTAICSEVTASGDKVLNINDLQVVNGMQTSLCIFNYFQNKKFKVCPIDSNRDIMVRLLKVSSDSSVRDAVVRATNNQTKIPETQLRGLDPLHRKIEDYFLSEGYFYERRKNHYKNLGKPKKAIVSLQGLAQASIALILREPDNAYGRPSNILTNDTSYKKLFNERQDMKAYLNAWKCISYIDEIIEDAQASRLLKYYKYYISYTTLCLYFKSIDYTAKQLTKVQFHQSFLRYIDQAISLVLYTEDFHTTPMENAKSAKFFEQLNHKISDALSNEGFNIPSDYSIAINNQYSLFNRY